MESPGKPPLEVLKWITQKGFVPGLKVAGSFVDTSHNLRKDHLQATKGGDEHRKCCFHRLRWDRGRIQSRFNRIGSCESIILLLGVGYAMIGRRGKRRGSQRSWPQGRVTLGLANFGPPILVSQLGLGGILDEGMVLIQTSDGGFTKAGETTSSDDAFGPHLGSRDVFLIKLSSDLTT